MDSRAAVVLSYGKVARYALHALAGALETDPATRGVELCAAFGAREVAAASRELVALGRRVVVAWSFYSAGIADAARELAAVRAAVPDGRVLHVAGGVHASADPAEALAAGFDLVGVGEGERTMVDVVARAMRGEDPGEAPGTARIEHGRVVSRGRGAPADLEALPPFPPKLGLFGPIEITRGCIYGCAFCQTPFLHRGRFRHRPPARVAEWVRLMRVRGLRDVRFITPSALSYGSPDGSVRLDAIEELLAMARAAAGASGRVFFGTFPSELRPEHVSPEALAVIRRHAANRALIIGGQSGSDRLLEAMRRGHDSESIVRAAVLAVEAGFRPEVDLIFGLPGETTDDAAATRRLMRRLADLGARVHAHAFLPLPGTPLRGARPGGLDPETQLDLDRLAARGEAYGQWRRQRDIGARLAARRSRIP